MSQNQKTYQELKDELDKIILELEANMDDIDKAIEQYQAAQIVIEEMEKYLDKTKVKIETLKPPK